MKAVLRKIAVVIITVMLFQVIMAAGSAGITAFAKVPSYKSKVKLKIKKLKMKIKEFRGRVKFYRVKTKQFKEKLKDLKSMLSTVPEGELRQSIAEVCFKLRKRISWCMKKRRIYKREVGIIRKRIRELAKLAKAKVMVGEASWYGGGIRESTNCAAMRGFRGHKVKVTNLANGKSVVVVINDYGPATWTGRVIDLSKAAFASIGSLGQGVIGRVRLEIY